MTPEDESRKYWDKHPIGVDSVPHPAGSHESFEAIYRAWKATEDDHRRAFVAECRGKRVLEIGCGIAKDGRNLVEHGVDYTGVDFSRNSLELASRHVAHASHAARFVRADATSLPFEDGEFDLVFSIGVLHHVPEMRRACSEAERVLRPGGTLRVMFYARDSYHYALVRFVVAPALHLALHIPRVEPLVRYAPRKLRELYGISKVHGWSVDRILASSADTSTAGEDNFTPCTYFSTDDELRSLFPAIEKPRFFRRDLKYFPLPFARDAVERRFGFFTTMTGTKGSH